MTSQIPANRLIRVLTGEKLRYTVRIHRADEVIEFQTDRSVKGEYSNEFRCPVLQQKINDYENSFVCLLHPTDIVTTEENK